MTDSMQRAMDETDRRRAIQQAYNQQHGIIPETIIRPVAMSLAGIAEADYVDIPEAADGIPDFKSQEDLDAYIAKLETDMREAAKRFEFEKAAKLRDTVRDLRSKEFLFT
jgi:excinuclease ABC subunit B